MFPSSNLSFQVNNDVFTSKCVFILIIVFPSDLFPSHVSNLTIMQHFKVCIIRDLEVRIKIENCNKKWFWKVNEKIMQECCTCNSSSNNEINSYNNNSSNTTNNIKTVFIQMTQKEKIRNKNTSLIPGP